jgi:hypothetical protein
MQRSADGEVQVWLEQVRVHLDTSLPAACTVFVGEIIKAGQRAAGYPQRMQSSITVPVQSYCGSKARGAPAARRAISQWHGLKVRYGIRDIRAIRAFTCAVAGCSKWSK